MMSETPEQLYQEREKRVMDAITLNKSDRVPFWGPFNLLLQNTEEAPQEKRTASYGSGNRCGGCREVGKSSGFYRTPFVAKSCKVYQRGGYTTSLKTLI